MPNNSSVKINMGGFPKTTGAAALRTIGQALMITDALLGAIGSVMIMLPNPATTIPGLAMVGTSGLLAGPLLSLNKSLTYQARLMGIKGLLAKRDMAALQSMFNRTQKVKNLLDPYKTWKEVPPDLKKSIALYIDEYYRNIGQLQQNLYLAQAQYNKRVEKEAAEARKQKGQ